MFVRGHGALGFDVRENIPRDVALENLKFCHERVLRTDATCMVIVNLR